ncbi:hypothetical protein I3843_15G030700 [Carya illinoinensis]|nr:hypothetical protein I3843_15G030700 [Carya illinoinensis]
MQNSKEKLRSKEKPSNSNAKRSESPLKRNSEVNQYEVKLHRRMKFLISQRGKLRFALMYFLFVFSF